MGMKFREEIKGLKRVVVKVGSNVITKKNGKTDNRKLRAIVEDICELTEAGVEVILVSSGAVSIGKHFLKKHLPKKGRIDLQQSASSIGQPKLLNIYSRLFEENQHICSQILLTHDDFRNRKRFLHVKQTVDVLLMNKVVPILNENDSISYSENSVGDNDHLAAQAAQMTNADLLLVITSAQGLFDRDPSENGAQLINTVSYGDNIEHVDMTTKTNVGRGGMESKVYAVNKVTQLGISAIIASKDNERIILDPLTQKTGTFFETKANYDPELRKSWLLSMKKHKCAIEVDRGAFEALLNGKSLFPKGIVTTEGSFFKGDSVDICYSGEAFASGITEYDSTEIELIKRKHSDDIEDILGHKAKNEVVHTINLVVSEEVDHDKISETTGV